VFVCMMEILLTVQKDKVIEIVLSLKKDMDP